MLKFLWFLPVLFCLPKNLFAENFSRIDSLSIQTPSETMHSMSNLVAYCENNALTDLSRVRFYFVWIATHIEYDETAGINTQNPETVFKTKKAVCSGFTRLLMQLCEQSGIPARYVAGYGKDINDATNIQNHAWNVICIDGQWHSFDVTWAASNLEEGKQIPLSPAFEEWFMPQMSVFQKTHLPFDPAYQLSNQLITRNDFFNTDLKNALYTVVGRNPDSLGKGVRNLDSIAKASDSNFNFTEILNEELSLDSLERTWCSLRRAYDFMPMDSAVAIKLAKTQAVKVKRVFDFVQQFNKNDYPKIKELTTDALKNNLSKLQNLENSLIEALKLHSELASFPLSDENKRTIKRDHLYYQKLLDFAKIAVKELTEATTLRE